MYWSQRGAWKALRFLLMTILTCLTDEAYRCLWQLAVLAEYEQIEAVSLTKESDTMQRIDIHLKNGNICVSIHCLILLITGLSLLQYLLRISNYSPLVAARYFKLLKTIGNITYIYLNVKNLRLRARKVFHQIYFCYFKIAKFSKWDWMLHLTVVEDEQLCGGLTDLLVQ